jgi:parallel beta-helix repeat protein
MLRRSIWLFAIWLCLPRPLWADTLTVHPGESIQAAIGMAPAGSTILVEPGTYQESGAAHALTVTQDGMQLIGLPSPEAPVVLEKSAEQEDGIWVSPSDTTNLVPPADDEHPPCGVSGARVNGFELRGFTIQGFPEFGVYLACVDGFTVAANTVQDTGVYSIFPVRSSKGRILRNMASGTTADACIYTGQDFDIFVSGNRASSCLLGFQIENSRNVRMVNNEAVDNTAGLFVDIIANDQVKIGTDNLVADNDLHDNNRPNMAPPDSQNAQIPPGLGLVINAADRTLVTGNTITGNGFAGIAISNGCIGGNIDCSQPLDIDPTPDFNRIVDNMVAGNGTSQTPVFGTTGADIIYLPDSGTRVSRGNCFRDNGVDLTVTASGPLPICPSPPPNLSIVRP